MCKALSFVVCENVYVSQEMLKDGNIVQKPQIICPIDTMKLLSIPSCFSFAIFGSLIDIPVDNENNVLYVVIYSPDGLEDFKTDEMKIPDLDKSDPNIKFSFDFRNYIFDVCGKYTVKLFINSSAIAETQFMVEIEKGSG